MKKNLFPVLIAIAIVLSACNPQTVPDGVVPTAAAVVQTQASELQTAAPTAVAEIKTQASSVATQLPTIVAPVQTAVAEIPGMLAGDVSVDYARNFKLEYENGYKILSILQPWAGANETYLYYLVPEGMELPEVPVGAQVFRTPVKRVISMSSTYLPFLEALGKLDSLVGIDDATYIYNEAVRQMAADDTVATIGGGASMAAVDLEKVIELKPDLILTSATGVPEMDSHPKLIEAGLPVALDADYLENDPLGRAEWGKFIAAFFDLEKEADAAFDVMVAHYDEIKALAASSAEKPSIFVNTDYQGTWYMPGTESYVALLLKDAGASYVFDDLAGVGSQPLKFEAVYENALEADYWLNLGFATDKASLLSMDARYADFKAVQEGRLYNYNARVNENGGVDYFESGVASPDLVLADLVKILHPQLEFDHTLYYYKQLQ